MAWKVAKGPEFEKGVVAHTSKNPKLRAELVKRMLKVEANPLCGDVKTGRYRACRSEHVADHWVLGWYLDPPIFQRGHLAKLEMVTFFFFGHHDEWD